MTKIGIIGAGIMGRGIAQVFLENECAVYLYDTNLNVLSESNSQIHAICREKNIDEELLRTAHHIEDLTPCMVVIEAIAENLLLKIDLIKKLSTILSDNTYLATNTSSFSITELSQHYKKPENFLGIHFMNPPSKTSLVEIIGGEKTDLETLEWAKRLIKSISKKPVLCKDRPGFLVNRILFSLIIEGIRVLEEETAYAQDIDEALMLGANLPMGPLKLADFIGLDTCLSILKTLSKGLNSNQFTPPPLLEKLVEKGHLGRKSGQGFYSYS